MSNQNQDELPIISNTLEECQVGECVFWECMLLECTEKGDRNHIIFKHMKVFQPVGGDQFWFYGYYGRKEILAKEECNVESMAEWDIDDAMSFIEELFKEIGDNELYAYAKNHICDDPNKLSERIEDLPFMFGIASKAGLTLVPKILVCIS